MPSNKRTQVDSPVRLASSIEPTISQRFIEPSFSGARRPLTARDTPLGQLGDSLAEIAPRLSSTLSAIAMTERDKALTVGQLEAQKAGAKATMEQINTQLKTLVDSGELSSARLPAAITGAETRLAALTAENSAFEKLYAHFEETSRFTNRTEPESVITKVYNELLGTIPKSLEARTAFDSEFARVAQAFRIESGRAYEKAAVEVQNNSRANRMSDLLLAFTASGDSETRARATIAIGQFIEGETGNGGYKSELDKHEVAQRVAQDAAPVIRELISHEKVDEALDLIDVLHDYDLTGQSGLLGKSGTAAEVLTNLRNEALSKDPSDFTQRQRKLKLEEDFALSQFRKDIVSLQGKALTRPEMSAFVSDFRAKNSDRPDAIYTYEKAIEDELKGDAISDPDVDLNIRRYLEQFKTTQAQELLATAQGARLINAKDAFLIEQEIRKTEELQGLYDPRDSAKEEHSLYDSNRDLNGAERPTFESADSYLTLSSDQRLEHRQKVMRFYEDQVKTRLRSSPDKTSAYQNLAAIHQESQAQTLKYADKVTADFVQENLKKEFSRKVRQQVSQLRSQTSLLNQAVKSGDVLGTIKQFASEVMKEKGFESSKFFDLLVADSGILSASAAVNDQSPSSTKTREAYMVLKSISGFTPDEIKNRKTKEGISFVPSRVSSAIVPVFDSLAQLDLEYNNGDPKPGGLFLEMKNLTAGGNRLNPAMFFANQKKLLENRPLLLEALQEELMKSSK
jgi:hypothetical protein